MALDWAKVKKKYGKGAEVPTIAGGKTLTVTGADDKAIYIKHPLWTAELSRKNLEKGVEMIEQGIIARDPGLFVEDYRIYVADERATSAAHILRDLGILDKDQSYRPRC
jgi:hypothetical protein